MILKTLHNLHGIHVEGLLSWNSGDLSFHLHWIRYTFCILWTWLYRARAFPVTVNKAITNPIGWRETSLTFAMCPHLRLQCHEGILHFAHKMLSPHLLLNTTRQKNHWLSEWNDVTPCLLLMLLSVYLKFWYSRWWTTTRFVCVSTKWCQFSLIFQSTFNQLYGKVIVYLSLCFEYWVASKEAVFDCRSLKFHRFFRQVNVWYHCSFQSLAFTSINKKSQKYLCLTKTPQVGRKSRQQSNIRSFLGKPHLFYNTTIINSTINNK